MDDFWSDGEDKKDVLMPIVEVPTPVQSEHGSEQVTARSDESEGSGNDTQRKTNDDSEEEEDEAEDELNSSRSKSERKKSKHKSKNGKYLPDMTPPDKLLRKAEKKTKRYVREKKVDKAMQELIRCTALARIVYGDGHWKLAKAYVDLAHGYLELRGYGEQAKQHAETAKTIMMTGVQTSSSSTDKSNIMEVLVNIYYIMGKALTLLKKYGEAEQALMKSETIANERGKQPNVTDDDLDEWEIKIFLAIARMAGKAQKYAMCASYFENALDLLQRKYGEDSVELIPVYQGLGKAEQGKGKHADHEKAIEHFLQAHTIASSQYRSGSLEIAETARALATAYSNTEDPDGETSAESYLNECLAVYQSVYGPHHEKTLDVQDELARLMVRTDRNDEALSLLKSTMEAKMEVFGDYSQEMADTHKLIGSVHLSMGNPEKALRSLKKCHNMEVMNFGANHKKCKDTQRTIDVLMANPNLARKQKTRSDELKERPRFSAVVGRSNPVGTSKTVAY